MNLQQKELFLQSLALIVAFVGILIFITMKEPAKTTLFSSLTEGDKAKVVESLRQKGIDVSLDTATGEVLVPSTDYYQSKMFLLQRDYLSLCQADMII